MDEIEQVAPETEQPLQESESNESQQTDVLDIDSVEKFKFGGREWTPKELKNAYMMQSDYTRKTQAIAEERKFYDNLSYDLEKVVKNPALVEEFKKVYPEKFHGYLNYVSKNQPEQGHKVEQTGEVDPKFMDRFSQLEQKINTYEQMLHEQRVAAVDAELDSKFKQLSEKYPMADEEAVIARAQSLISRGEKLDDKVWDVLWKSVNDKNQKLAEQFYKKKVTQQQTINKQGKDIASGGGQVGQAPARPRTIKEATQMALSE